MAVINTLMLAALFLLIGYIFYKDRMPVRTKMNTVDRLLALIVVITVELLLDSLMSLLASLIIDGFGMTLEPGGMEVFMGRGLALILAASIALMRRGAAFRFPAGRMTVITISLVALFFYVTLLLLWDNMASGGSSVMLALFIFISLASAMSITSICIDSYRRDKLAEGQAALEHITSLKLLLAAMEDNNEKTRCYRHDMKNHLAVIRDLAREGCDEKIVDYIDEWQNKADHGVRPIFASGNKIMDAVILEAAMAAEKGGVKLRCRGNICEPYFVSDFDLCTIVSNLLLNAIEYAGDKGFPEVFLDLLVQGDVSVIEVRNPIEAGLNVEEAIRTTSKKDRENHGNGIRNVRETVEAWYGCS